MFEGYDNPSELSQAFTDMLDLFELRDMALEDTRVILTELMCSTIVEAYSIKRPYQDWYIRWGKTLKDLEPDEMELLATRIVMEARMKRARETEEGDSLSTTQAQN